MRHIANNPVLQWISIIIIALVAVFFYVKYDNSWSKARAGDQVELFGSFSEPVRVDINSDDWEGDVYVSGDGDAIYYSYYPGNLEADIESGRMKDGIDIYYSLRPFNRSEKHTISEDNWSEGGVMFAGSDIYYSSDRNSQGLNNLYKNGQMLAVSDSSLDEKDPYYCSSLNELYFTANDSIYVSIDDQSNILPEPINNNGSINIQPFLTSDCQTMYFTSDRDDGVLKIYKSTRHEKGWNKPELIVRSKYGVGSPSLTDDEKTMFFVQAFQSPRGKRNVDIFYVEMGE
jgi:Tol biopolymer transport system component